MILSYLSISESCNSSACLLASGILYPEVDCSIDRAFITALDDNVQYSLNPEYIPRPRWPSPVLTFAANVSKKPNSIEATLPGFVLHTVEQAGHSLREPASPNTSLPSITFILIFFSSTIPTAASSLVPLKRYGNYPPENQDKCGHPDDGQSESDMPVGAVRGKEKEGLLPPVVVKLKHSSVVDEGSGTLKIILEVNYVHPQPHFKGSSGLWHTLSR